jgi:RNA polymerase sigma factor (sigma-70 family)
MYKLKENTTNEENLDLIEKAQDGCIKSRNELIENNLGLILRVANKFNPTGIEQEDLVNEGVFGMIRAIEKFDAAMGFKFSTYATIWIRQAVTRGIADKSRNVRWPVHFFQKKIALHSITNASNSKEIGMNVDEVAELMGVSKGRAKMLLESDMLELSTEHQYTDEDGGGKTMHDTDELLTEETQSHVDEIFNETLREIVSTSLTEKQAKVIGLRYGLHDGETYSLSHIGTLLGVSRERVRQIEVKAIKEIARIMRIDFNMFDMY